MALNSTIAVSVLGLSFARAREYLAAYSAAEGFCRGYSDTINKLARGMSFDTDAELVVAINSAVIGAYTLPILSFTPLDYAGYGVDAYTEQAGTVGWLRVAEGASVSPHTSAGRWNMVRQATSRAADYSWHILCSYFRSASASAPGLWPFFRLALSVVNTVRRCESPSLSGLKAACYDAIQTVTGPGRRVYPVIEYLDSLSLQAHKVVYMAVLASDWAVAAPAPAAEVVTILTNLHTLLETMLEKAGVEKLKNSMPSAAYREWGTSPPNGLGPSHHGAYVPYHATDIALPD